MVCYARGCLGLLVVGKVSDLSIVNSKEFVRSLNEVTKLWTDLLFGGSLTYRVSKPVTSQR
jgi:hypothetical protein